MTPLTALIWLELFIGRARYHLWRLRWADAIADQSISIAAETVADDLPEAAQIAILQGCPWNLILTPVVEQQLALFDLLDGTMAGLSGLGIQVFRSLHGRDRDFSRRQDEYAKWFDLHYADAYKTAAPGHAAANAVLFMDPQAQDPLLVIAAARSEGIVIGHPEDCRVAAYLAGRGLVSIRQLDQPRRRPRPSAPPQHAVFVVEATSLGRSGARLLRLARRKHAELFAGAKCSAEQAAWDRETCRLVDRMTRRLGAMLARHDADGANA
jgi:hypothetical protein